MRVIDVNRKREREIDRKRDRQTETMKQRERPMQRKIHGME